MSRDLRVAVYTASRNLYPYMLPAVKSLLVNSNVDKIYLLIEDDVFPFELPDCIETINVSDQPYFDADGPNMSSHFTYLSMMRGVLAKVFPQYEKIVSFDCDAICVHDVSDLWDIELGDNYLGACVEPVCCAGGKSYKAPVYMNTGVAIYNLKKLRDTRIVDTIIMNLNHKAYVCPEQDALNEFCQGHMLNISSDYNCCSYTEPTNSPKVIHYAGIMVDRWSTQLLVKKYGDMSWEEVLKEHDNKQCPI